MKLHKFGLKADLPARCSSRPLNFFLCTAFRWPSHSRVYWRSFCSYIQCDKAHIWTFHGGLMDLLWDIPHSSWWCVVNRLGCYVCIWATTKCEIFNECRRIWVMAVQNRTPFSLLNHSCAFPHSINMPSMFACERYSYQTSQYPNPLTCWKETLSLDSFPNQLRSSVIHNPIWRYRNICVWRAKVM